MPIDIYLKTTNYPAQPYAGPGILCMPQIVPWACLPTLPHQLLGYGPHSGQGQMEKGGREKALPLPLGHSPCSPLVLPSVPSYSPTFGKPQKGRGHYSSMPLGLGTALASWHLLLPQYPVLCPCRPCPIAPAGAGGAAFTPQTHLSQPSTPSLLPDPRRAKISCGSRWYWRNI